MSNLYKFQMISKEQNVRKIDSNALLQEKLGKAEKKVDFQSFDMPADNEFHPISFGEKKVSPETLKLQQMMKRHKSRAPHQELMDDMLEAARIEADTIVLDARERADELKMQAFEEGRHEGYEDGLSKGRDAGYEESYGAGKTKLEQDSLALEQRSRELDMREKELEIQQQNLEKRYQRRFEEMEPVLVRTIANVFDKVFKVQYSEKQEILLHLVKKTLNKIESSKEFFIRVSREDFDFMMEHKKEIIERVGRTVELGIMEDPSLMKGQCVVETDGGVFDCGIDTQLENLVNDLKALSS